MPRRRSGGQVVTFLLGVVVGACLCYGFLSATGVPLPDPGMGTIANPADPAIPIPEVPTDELADINGLWPAKHLVLVLDEPNPTPETLELLGAFKPGGVIVNPRLQEDPAAMRELTTAYRRAVGRENLPIVIAADMGNPNPLADGPPPAYFSLGSVGEPTNAIQAGSDYGIALRERGLDAAMAPWTSVAIDGQADPSTAWVPDPAQSAVMANAYWDGLVSEGVLPIALAFPGMGLARPVDDYGYRIDEQELRLIASHMVPLREVAAAQVPGILVSHTTVPVLDKRFPDRPASISPTLVGGILRGKWEYHGVALADDIALLAQHLGKPVEELFVQSLAAGCDAVILSKPDRTTLRRICAALVALVDAGGVDPKSLDESKQRLAQWPSAIATFNKRTSQPGPAPQPEDTVLLRHSVQPGETLIGISRLHNVKLRELKNWNGLFDSNVTPGQKLNVYLPKIEGPEDVPVEEISQEETLEEITEPESTSDAPQPQPEETNEPVKVEEQKPESVDAEKTSTTVHSLPEVEAASSDAPMEAPAAEPEQVDEPEKESEPAAPAEPVVDVNQPSEESPAEAPAPLVPMDSQADQQPPADEADEATPAIPPLKLGKFHIWAEGDTMESVAALRGISVDQLKELNLFDVAPPSPGMEVVVVAPSGSATPPASDKELDTYTVKAGDTLHKIALQHGISAKQLVELNGLKSADHIIPGQKLKVPKKS